MINQNMTEHDTGSDTSSDDKATPPPGGFVLTVRIKGMVVFAALITYALVIALFVFHEKRELLLDFDRIQKTFEVDSMLKEADTAAFHTVMGVFVNLDTPDREAGMHRVRAHYQSLRIKHEDLKAHMPELDVSLDGISKVLAAADADPSRSNMLRLTEELVKVRNEFTRLAGESQQMRARMAEQYRTQAHSVAVTTLLLVMLGLALLGTITGLFFKQLTQDLRTLQKRALDIVNGYRGAPIPVRRHDEVGQLMAAVNGMACRLDAREKELLLERQKYFHQEKMAAIGALAAGVAHEIGNPIAAISGIAQEMAERCPEHADGCSHNITCVQCRPDLILAQTQRLAAITREISEFSSPQPAEPQFLDLNAQLRSTTSLIRYDKRMREVDLKLNLDRQLPAIYGIGDQLTQLIMNLLINAVDALETVTDRPRQIRITTDIADDCVRLAIEDDGVGMEKDVLERAFEAFYTTKPAGKGTGLGLSLCYSIMKKHEGSIDIESTPGIGTRVQVFFPIKELI